MAAGCNPPGTCTPFTLSKKPLIFHVFGCKQPYNLPGKTSWVVLSASSVNGTLWKRQNLPAARGVTRATYNSVAPVAVYITCQSKGLLSITAPNLFITLGLSRSQLNHTAERSLHSASQQLRTVPLPVWREQSCRTAVKCGEWGLICYLFA